MNDQQGYEHEYDWTWCDTCECAMVICPQCGLNSCSGGANCDLCMDVYAWVELQYADDNYPKTREEIKLFNKREIL